MEYKTLTTGLWLHGVLQRKHPIYDGNPFQAARQQGSLCRQCLSPAYLCCPASSLRTWMPNSGPRRRQRRVPGFQAARRLKARLARCGASHGHARVGHGAVIHGWHGTHHRDAHQQIEIAECVIQDPVVQGVLHLIVSHNLQTLKYSHPSRLSFKDETPWPMAGLY